MRRLIWTGLATLALLIAAPGAARAATPFTAGSGSDPGVAVGFDGSAHVVWMTGGPNVQVGYCRVSAGHEACNRTELLNFGASTAANSIGRATVFAPAPNKVVIEAGCWNCPRDLARKSYLWTSTNNGSSFGSPVQIGEGFDTNGVGTWLDSSNLFVAANSNSVKALNFPPTGSPVPIAPVGYSFGPEVVRLPGTNTLVAASNNLDAVGYGVYGGPSLTATAVNTPANWAASLGLSAAEPDNSETSLNAGPNGIYLAYKSLVPGNTRLGLRRFDPVSETFGGPAYVQGEDPIDTGSLDHPDSFQDLTGKLHLVWRSLHDGGRLRYRAGDATATSFGPVGTLAAGENFTDPEVAVGNETGFAVWTQGTSGPVRVVPVDPRPESAPPGASPTDGERPAVSGAMIGDRTLRPGQGTTFRFRSSKSGQAVLTIEKQFKGLKGKKRKGKRACLPRTKKRLRALRKQAGTPRAYRKLLKKRSCRAYKRVGEIRQRVRAGANTIVFNGRVAGRKLGKGSYRAKLVVTDSAGQRSRSEFLKFKVIGPKKVKKKGGRR